jgi:hypothetical protein
MLVMFDGAEVEPPAPVAVTTRSILSPMSPDCTTYVELVAPLMSAQAPPVQSCHRYAYLVGLLVHEPVDPVSMLPCVGAPLIVGGSVFAGDCGPGGEGGGGSGGDALVVEVVVVPPGFGFGFGFGLATFTHAHTRV